MEHKDIEPISSQIIPNTAENDFGTYLSTAEKLFEEHKDFYKEEDKKAILSFAKYLDSFKTLSIQMQFLALQQSRKIDREVLFAMSDALGKEKTTEIINGVYSNHRHTESK